MKKPPWGLLNGAATNREVDYNSPLASRVEKDKFEG
jgi:hypothetical protein